MLLGTVCCLAWGMNPSVVQARSTPSQPSVEVNFDALRPLEQAQPQPDLHAIPSPQPRVPRPGDVPVAERKMPREQPAFTRHAPTAIEKPLPARREVPVAQPLPLAPAPIMRLQPVTRVAPMQQPAPIAAPSLPVYAPVPSDAGGSYVPQAPISKAKKKSQRHSPRPVEEAKPFEVKPATAALPEVAPPVEPAPLPEKLPAAKPVKGAKATKAPKPATPAPSLAPVVPVLPDLAAPKISTPDMPPPLPDAKDPKVPPALPVPVPGAAAGGPDVNKLDFSKMPAPPPAEPPMVFVPSKTPAPLPPSVEKRVDAMTAKEPAKQGIISDKTRIDDPTTTMRKDLKSKERDKAEAAAEAKVKETKPLPPVDLPAPPALPDAKAPAKAATPEKLPPAELPLPPASAKAVEPAPTVITFPADAPPPLPDAKPGDNATSLKPAPFAAEVKADGKKVTSTMVPTPLPKPDEKKEDVPAVTPQPMAPLPPAGDMPPALPDAKPEVPSPALKDAAKSKTPPPPPINLPAVTPAEGTIQPITKTVVFDKDKSDLPDAAKGELGEMAEKIKQSATANVRIVAYASGTPEQASVAKRISLSRALAIRAFLIGKGVNQLNINVQALGNQVPGGEADRADVFVK